MEYLNIRARDVAPLDQPVHWTIVRLAVENLRIELLRHSHVRSCECSVNSLDLHFARLPFKANLINAKGVAPFLGKVLFAEAVRAQKAPIRRNDDGWGIPLF